MKSRRSEGRVAEKNVSGVIGDKRVAAKVNVKVDKRVVRPAPVI